jgi:hypothetical protein
VTKVKRLGLIELMREEKDRRDLEATEDGYKLVACMGRTVMHQKPDHPGTTLLFVSLGDE